VTFAILISSQLVFLVLRILDHTLKTDASVAADVLSLIATNAALILSLLGHKRSLRPGTLLSLYLSMVATLGIARTRTLWLMEVGGPVPAMMAVVLSLTTLSLLLESIERIPAVVLHETTVAPEVRSGFWTRTCFLWLASTFRSGYSKILSIKHLPPLDTKLESHLLEHKLVKTWDKCKYHDFELFKVTDESIDDQNCHHSLLRACFRSYFLSFLSPIIPQICLTAFTFSQPFIINTTIGFIGQKTPDPNYGKGLIGACALVYMGIAVRFPFNNHNRFRHSSDFLLAGIQFSLCVPELPLHDQATRGIDRTYLSTNTSDTSS